MYVNIRIQQTDGQDAEPLRQARGTDIEAAAELFGVLSTPIRLRIIGALCGVEKNVSQLLQEIDVSQPNMSQQLNVLYRAGVVDKRRDGAQMYYRIADEAVVRVCKVVCTQIHPDGEKPADLP